MRERRQISHAEEFKIIDVDTSSSRRWNIVIHSLSMGYSQLLLSKEDNMQSVKE